jgi:hypothetical protein
MTGAPQSNADRTDAPKPGNKSEGFYEGSA